MELDVFAIENVVFKPAAIRFIAWLGQSMLKTRKLCRQVPRVWLASLVRHNNSLRVCAACLPEKEKRVDSQPRNQRVSTINFELRPAEQLAGINVPGQSAWGHVAQIVNASGVWTVEHAGSVCGSGVGITARRWWSVLTGAVFLDRVADQCATGRTNRCSNGCASRTASGQTADNCTGACAGGRALASGSITGLERKRSERSATDNREKLFVHIWFLR
jgi:hypothetical protein